ncbi:MAG: S-adenosylmethionine decarboxylase [Proteobacteria bacterium]|jgi:S-adenosylmethionine decarboxylase|nr:S-adenosylmethionine decarboxylase [Pseudomonadota bacterium]
MQGLHLTADLHDCRCDPAWLTDAEALLAACEQAVAQVGLKAVDRLTHSFPGTLAGAGGVTAAVLLAESHLCLHTWPEQRAVTLDVYVCNHSADHGAAARQLLLTLEALFSAAQVQRHALRRGTLPAPAGDTGSAA